jgi:enoyl-CoA hydratase/carnithine racemase
VELMSGVAVLPVPERLHEAGVRALEAALAAAAEASVIVLEGAPERFCLGMDFTGAADHTTPPRPGLERFAGLLGRLLRAPRPTLAVIDGPALGGGLGLAAACDFVLASERATFGLPEALYGLAPAIIRPALLTRLSPQQLRVLLFSCHTRGAAEAATLGLVDRVVGAEALAAARRYVLRQLGRARSETVRACRRWDEDELERRLRAGVGETAAALADPNVRAALHAFTSEEGLPWRP